MEKKILMFGPYKKGQDTPLPGGIARWVFDFINSPYINAAYFEIVDLSIVGDRYKKSNIFKKFRNEFLRTRRISKQTKNALKNNSVDVAHFHSSCGKLGVVRDYFLLKKLAKKKVKIITHFHCNLNLHANQGWLTNKFFKKTVAISSKVIVLNEISMNEIKIINPTSNVINIPNFIKYGEVRTTPKKIAETINNIVFVGFVQKEKGINEIYEVARVFPDITFKLIGKISLEFKTVDKPNNVALMNVANRETIFKELDSADLFLFPSHSEGFSLAMLEAMARGLPIICTDVGANKDMINNNSGGIITKVNSASEIIDAINMMKSVDFRTSCSIYNVEKVKTMYTDEIVIRKILELYE
jgi:glycosyltransferase involved in cell wall biosynthesis